MGQEDKPVERAFIVVQLEVDGPREDAVEKGRFSELTRTRNGVADAATAVARTMREGRFKLTYWTKDFPRDHDDELPPQLAALNEEGLE